MMKIDCIGLSFIQNAKILVKLKKNIHNTFMFPKLKTLWDMKKD